MLASLFLLSSSLPPRLTAACVYSAILAQLCKWATSRLLSHLNAADIAAIITRHNVVMGIDMAAETRLHFDSGRHSCPPHLQATHGCSAPASRMALVLCLESLRWHRQLWQARHHSRVIDVSYQWACLLHWRLVCGPARRTQLPCCTRGCQRPASGMKSCHHAARWMLCGRSWQSPSRMWPYTVTNTSRFACWCAPCSLTNVAGRKTSV